jgi:hypothetical protein
MTLHDINNAIMGLLVFGGVASTVLGLYFFPSILARARRLSNFWSIFVLNLFLGWTLLGWVIPLAMAASGTAARRASP